MLEFDPEFNTVCRSFFELLKNEIVIISKEINSQNDGSLQDGFSTRTIDDGWVSYKGMSCGFAFQPQPTCISMTFGPDSPFVGYSIRLLPSLIGGQLVWIDENGRMRFNSANQLARFAIETLAAKVHDYLPEMVDFELFADSQAALQ